MFKKILKRIKVERSGKKPQKRKKKPKPKKVTPKKKKDTPKKKKDEIKLKIEKEEIKEEEQERETEPPLTVETEKEEEILENKKLEIEEIKEKNYLLEKEVIKMTEQQEEIPLMKFESDATAPILRYDLPSPSSYEGKNYIELNDIPAEKFNEQVVYNTKSYEEVMNKNREEIRKYLSNISKAELEEDFYGL